MTQVVFIPYTTIVYSDFSQQTFAKHTQRSCGEGIYTSFKNSLKRRAAWMNFPSLGITRFAHEIAFAQLFASLMIPNEEAKDENQKHLCFANLILCPCKNSLKRRAAWMNFPSQEITRFACDPLGGG